MDESDPETVRLTGELRNTPKNYCAKCKLLFKPTNEFQDTCHICVPVNTPVFSRSQEDRKREASMSPERSDDEPKRNKQESFDIFDQEGKRISIYLDNLDKLDQKTMIMAIHSLLGYMDKYKSLENILETKIANLTQELTQCKVAFADKALKFLNELPPVNSCGTPTLQPASSTMSYAAAVSGGMRSDTGSVVLVAEASKQVDLGQMDNLLGSKANGPIAQHIRQKENKVILTFSDEAAKEKAKSIMKSSP